MLYCDCAAATPPNKEVLNFYNEALSEYFGNQESIHPLGFKLRKALNNARSELSQNLTNSSNYEILWSNSATGAFQILEHSNLWEKKSVYTTHFEHHALSALLKRKVEKLNFFPHDQYGRVTPQGEENCDIAIICGVNSEIGTIQNLSEIKNSFSNNPITVVDYVQGAGKIPLTFNPDIIIISGVKFGAPSGGALLVKKNMPNFNKFIASCQSNRNPNYYVERFNVPIALTMNYALKLKMEKISKNLRKMREINEFLRTNLSSKEIIFTIPSIYSSPYILHLTLPHKQGAVILRMLGEKNIMCSSGSACASESNVGSEVLKHLGYNKKESFSGLRLSFDSSFNLEDGKFLTQSIFDALKNY